MSKKIGWRMVMPALMVFTIVSKSKGCRSKLSWTMMFFMIWKASGFTNVNRILIFKLLKKIDITCKNENFKDLVLTWGFWSKVWYLLDSYNPRKIFPPTVSIPERLKRVCSWYLVSFDSEFFAHMMAMMCPAMFVCTPLSWINFWFRIFCTSWQLCALRR